MDEGQHHPAQAAYWRVMATVEDARLDQEALYAVWRPCFDAGDARLAATGAALIPGDLTWPLFDQWAERFGPETPYTWQPGIQLDLKAAVLLHTITQSAHGLVRVANLLRAFGHQGLQFGAPLPHNLTWKVHFALPEPPAVRRVCEEGAAQLLAGDWSALPPFFPGDRTGWSIMPRPRSTARK